MLLRQDSEIRILMKAKCCENVDDAAIRVDCLARVGVDVKNNVWKGENEKLM